MQREKRFVVTFTDVSSCGEDQQDASDSQPPGKSSRQIQVSLSYEEEQAAWIRDHAQQEHRRLGQQSEVRNAVTKVIRTLCEKRF